MKIGDNEYKLSDFDTQKKTRYLKKWKCKIQWSWDMVYRFQLTYDEIIDFLDLKYIPTKRTGYSLTPGIYEITDNNLMLKRLLPNNVKISTTIDIRLKSNLNNNQTLIFTKKSFFYTVLGFTQSHSRVLGDIEGFVQLIPGTYRSEKPNNITGMDKIHLKCDCFNGSTVNGIR